VLDKQEIIIAIKNNEPIGWDLAERLRNNGLITVSGSWDSLKLQRMKSNELYTLYQSLNRDKKENNE
jgi:enoyl-[acyl-carrier-protein] reductase (NADH)